MVSGWLLQPTWYKRKQRFMLLFEHQTQHIILFLQDKNRIETRNKMNLNTKQQTMQYTTIPDGDGGGDDVVVRRPTPWWTGRSYSVLGGLILLLVAAAVVLQGGGGGRPYDLVCPSYCTKSSCRTKECQDCNYCRNNSCPSYCTDSSCHSNICGGCDFCRYNNCSSKCTEINCILSRCEDCDICRNNNPAGSILDGGVFGTSPTSADGLVLASITNLQNDAEDGCNPNPWCTGSGCC